MPDPYSTTWERWTARFLEDYSDQSIPQRVPITDWQYWAAVVAATAYFANQGAPNPVGFSDWRDWAAALMLVINPGI